MNITALSITVVAGYEFNEIEGGKILSLFITSMPLQYSDRRKTCVNQLIALDIQ